MHLLAVKREWVRVAIFSLLIHAFVYGLLLAWVWWLIRPSSTLQPEISVPIEVEFIKPAPIESEIGKGVTSSQGVRPSHSIHLSQLGVRLSTGTVSPIDPSHRKSSETDDSGKSEVPNGAPDFKQESASYPAYRFIFDRIDANLTYPDVFKKPENQFTGWVDAKIKLDANGKFDEPSSTFDSDSRFLRVTAIQAVRKGLAHELPAECLKKLKGNRLIVATFHFEKVEPKDMFQQEAKAYQLGAQLNFHRFFVRPEIAWDVGPIHGIGPIPRLDILWFFKKAADAFDQDAKFDPLDAYRNDPAW